MQTLGELLIKTREEKGYTVDQVIHETNISRSYIENLEAENFEQFPAEAYLIGFLRTYADYLGLDQDRVITLYKNHKLREEPAPLEALVGKKRPSIPLPVLLIMAAVLALGAAGYFLYPSLSQWLEVRSSERQSRAEGEAVRRPMDFPVTGESQEFHVLSGDTVTFSQGGQSCVFLVSDIETGLELVKQDSDDPGLMLNLGKEEFLSLFRDSPDYRIYLKDYGFTDGGGVLTVEPIEQNEMQRDEGDAPLDIGEIDTTPPSGVQSRQVDPQIIYTVNSGERYTLDIKFRSYCLLRYKKDNDEAVQKYYKEGDTLRVEVNNRIALWLSNAGAVYAKVNSHELDLGDAGQVAAKRIQWAKTPTGQYELLLLNVY